MNKKKAEIKIPAVVPLPLPEWGGGGGITATTALCIYEYLRNVMIRSNVSTKQRSEVHTATSKVNRLNRLPRMTLDFHTFAFTASEQRRR